MKKQIIIASMLLVGLLPAMPASANPQSGDNAEIAACFTKLLERPDIPPDRVSLLYSVEHEGDSYHVLKSFNDGPLTVDVTTYIRMDGQGGCEKLMDYAEGSHPPLETYRERLGAGAFEKLRIEARKFYGNKLPNK